MKAGTQGVTGMALALLAGSVLAAQSSDSDVRTIEAEQQQAVGSYLTDEQGRSVYMFEADSKNEATCYDDCAQAWPPVVTQARPKAGTGVDENKLGTIERKDGSMQVTYNDWPLYYFIKDKQPGDINGQEVNGFGAEWYLLTPDGQVAKAAGQEKKQEG